MKLAGRVLLLVCVACGGGNGGGGGPGRRTVEVDGQTREFLVAVPESAPASGAPVVFMFHGTGGDGAKFLEISGWAEKATEEGLIAVFPTALVNCLREDENADGDFTDPGEFATTTKWIAWDWATSTKFQQCTADEIAMLPADKRAQADHPYPDDVAFVEAMIANLRDENDVDLRRLYATGFSNGGAFTARLALERSNVFAAVASSAGALQLPAAAAARPLPYIFTLGSTDEKLTAALGVTEVPVSATAYTDAPALAAAMQPSLTITQMTSDSTYSEVVVGGKKVGTHTHATSTVGASNYFKLVVFEGLAHQYANGNNHPAAMVDVLWPLFEAQSLPR